MRTLIIVKKGEETITNRDVSDAGTKQTAINELVAAYPEGVQFFMHECKKGGCIEKEFTPEVIPAEKKPEEKHEKPEKVKPDKMKKGQPPAVKRSND